MRAPSRGVKRRGAGAAQRKERPTFNLVRDRSRRSRTTARSAAPYHCKVHRRPVPESGAAPPPARVAASHSTKAYCPCRAGGPAPRRSADRDNRLVRRASSSRATLSVSAPPPRTPPPSAPNSHPRRRVSPPRAATLHFQATRDPAAAGDHAQVGEGVKAGDRRADDARVRQPRLQVVDVDPNANPAGGGAGEHDGCRVGGARGEQRVDDSIDDEAAAEVQAPLAGG